MGAAKRDGGRSVFSDRTFLLLHLLHALVYGSGQHDLAVALGGCGCIVGCGGFVVIACRSKGLDSAAEGVSVVGRCDFALRCLAGAGAIEAGGS